MLRRNDHSFSNISTAILIDNNFFFFYRPLFVAKQISLQFCKDKGQQRWRNHLFSGKILKKSVPDFIVVSAMPPSCCSVAIVPPFPVQAAELFEGHKMRDSLRSRWTPWPVRLSLPRLETGASGTRGPGGTRGTWPAVLSLVITYGSMCRWTSVLLLTTACR